MLLNSKLVFFLQFYVITILSIRRHRAASLVLTWAVFIHIPLKFCAREAIVDAPWVHDEGTSVYPGVTFFPPIPQILTLATSFTDIRIKTTIASPDGLRVARTIPSHSAVKGFIVVHDGHSVNWWTLGLKI